LFAARFCSEKSFARNGGFENVETDVLRGYRSCDFGRGDCILRDGTKNSGTEHLAYAAAQIEQFQKDPKKPELTESGSRTPRRAAYR
jgi:hypothetical protein